MASRTSSRTRKAASTATPAPKRRQTKKARRTKAEIILGLLQRKNGASIAEMSKATGWQAHSIRAALSGLRKSGKTVERKKTDSGKAVYRLARV